MKNICVVHTKIKQEIKAEFNLKNQGFKTWLPMIKRVRGSLSSPRLSYEPLFPTYLFVYIDLMKENWFKINNTYGVKYLITFDGKPSLMNNRVLEEIRSSIDESQMKYKLSIGNKVQVSDGMFKGFRGTIVDLCKKDRVKILLDLLNGKLCSISLRKIVPLY